MVEKKEGAGGKKSKSQKGIKPFSPNLVEAWQVSCSTFSLTAFLITGAGVVQCFRGHWNYLTSKTWRCTGLGRSVSFDSLASGKPEDPLLKIHLGAILLLLPKLGSTLQLFPEFSELPLRQPLLECVQCTLRSCVWILAWFMISRLARA